MRRRKITEAQMELRETILHKIAELTPLSEGVRQLQSIEGFYEIYLKLRPCFPNNIEAYEALETEYIRIFGHRKYSEYDSFRGSIGQKK